MTTILKVRMELPVGSDKRLDDDESSLHLYTMVDYVLNLLNTNPRDILSCRNGVPLLRNVVMIRQDYTVWA